MEESPKPTPRNYLLKRYVLEFLVVFIAVFLGFLADSYRESLSNHRTEKNLAKGLLRDLRKDKLLIDTLISLCHERKAAVDTFITVRHLDISKKNNQVLFYRLFFKCRFWNTPLYRPTETTLTHIRATGSLSIFEPSIGEIVSKLDNGTVKIKFNIQYPLNHAEETFRMIYELTDYMSAARANYSGEEEFPPLQIDDKIKLLKFFNLCADYGLTLNGYINDLTIHQILITRTIENLEKEFE